MREFLQEIAEAQGYPSPISEWAPSYGAYSALAGSLGSSQWSLEQLYQMIQKWAQSIPSLLNRAGTEFEGKMFSGIGPAKFGGDHLVFPAYFANGDVTWIRLDLDPKGIRIRHLGGTDPGRVISFDHPGKAMQILLDKVFLGGHKVNNLVGRLTGKKAAFGARRYKNK